jgi:DNA-binding MarR family transcriptional regulator
MENLVGLLAKVMVEQILLQEERDALEVLYQSEYPLTAVQISKKIKTTSYPTVSKILKDLEKQGFVKSRKLHYKRKWVVWSMPSYVKRRYENAKRVLKK